MRRLIEVRLRCRNLLVFLLSEFLFVFHKYQAVL